MANDYTVRIFDQFYALDLVVNADEYEIVYSYFVNYSNNATTAKYFTEALFRISNITQVSVMDLLATFQTGSNPDVTRIMAYYLNSVSSKNVLYGVNQVSTPNFPVARNVIETLPPS